MAKKKIAPLGVFILLDRSGSMVSNWAESLTALNSYIEGLAIEKDTKTAKITLAAFDASQTINYDILRSDIPASSWKPITEDEATPRGMTPLNDAAMRIIGAMKEANHERSVLVVITDGHENASRSADIQAVRGALNEIRAKGWQTVFLGADFDNAHQAMSYGNSSHQTISAAKGAFVRATEILRRETRLYASGGASPQGMVFTDEDKKNVGKV